MRIDRKNTPNQYELWGDVEALVLHTTLGAYAGAVRWLMMSAAERKRRYGKATYSSAHAVFGREGEITELAPPNKGTWHAGAISNPSKRALDVLPKNAWGKLKNPNRFTIGLEFASGYDIDKDAVIEDWEKLYTEKQVQAAAWYILNELEPKIGKKFDAHNIITHRDIASYKPDLEIQRSMVIMELARQRRIKENPPQPTPPPTPAPVEPTPGSGIIISIEEAGQVRKYRGTLIN